MPDETTPSTGVAAPSADAPTPQKPPAFLTVDEAAGLLRVNRKTLYDAIKAGRVPGALRLGRKLRISAAALLTFGLGSARPDGAER